MSVDFDAELNGQHAQSMQLALMLEKVAELIAEKDRLESETSRVKKALRDLENLAVEQLSLSGLDGVRAAGKSWYVREFIGLSVPKENRERVVEAARAAGLDDFVAVNTSSLKTWLKEQRGDGADGGDLAAGTPFEGLLSEYREVRLSHITVS